MGMAGMLAASHRTPVAALLMVSEIAGTYLLLVPTMWVVGIAFLATGRRSLIAGQVDAMQDSPAHRDRLFADVLATATIAELLTVPRAWTSIPASAPVDACHRLIGDSVQEQFPVVHEDGRLIGVIDRQELAHWVAEATKQATAMVAGDLALGAGAALSPRDSLAVALQSLHQQCVDALPVVDGQGRFLTLITSGMVMEHYRCQMERAYQERAADGSPTLAG
jgi:CIC family chloride channel protein